MRPMRMSTRAAGLVVAALVLTGCTTVAEIPVPAAGEPTAGGASTGGAGAAPTATPSAPATPAPTCTEAEKTSPDVVRSYAPAGDIAAAVAADPFLRSVRERGRLVVGVSADTRLFGARDPRTNRIEGFDIDMLKAISRAVLGKESIEYRVITTAQRIPLLQDGTVDIVARTMTITCERWKQIAFSAVYYQAGQKVLVPRAAPGAQQPASIEALPDGARVCAPKGSTSIERVKERYSRLTAVEAAVHTDCLVLFQQGRVDAITGDDAILAGFAAQDPYAVVVGKAFSSEPYGLAIKKENRAFVSVVNAVLDQVRTGGAWAQSYQANGLAAALGPATPPAPSYGRR